LCSKNPSEEIIAEAFAVISVQFILPLVAPVVAVTTAADLQLLHLTPICRPKKTGESGLNPNKNEYI
jgi:hypothetical protein